MAYFRNILSSSEDKNTKLKFPLRPFRGTCILPSTSCTEVKPLNCVKIKTFPELTS